MPTVEIRKFSICFLDDKIPLPLDSGLIDHRALKLLLLDSEKWKGDTALFELVKELNSDSDKYILSGFLHCDNFIRYIDEVIFSPDVIVFDWDYPGGSAPEEALLKILKCQYSMVFIFAGVDKKEEINNAVSTSRFKKHKKRLDIIIKGETDSINKLKSGIISALDNFSFKYSNELKQKTIKAIDRILSSMSELSFDEFIRVFGRKVTVGAVTKRQLSCHEFSEIIADKIKTMIIESGLGEDGCVDDDGTQVDENLIREIWGFRLYHQPKDSIVRRGDIFEIHGNKVMVISADCDLEKFWQKNMGHLMVTPLYRMDDAQMKKDLNDYNGTNLNGFKITSLTNPRQIESITVLPGLMGEENDGVKIYWDYIVAAKATYSMIIKPENIPNPQTSLQYEHIEDIGESFKSRKRIAEPFLTPLIQFIMQNITGLGVPDFSESLQTSLKNKVREIKNNAGT